MITPDPDLRRYGRRRRPVRSSTLEEGDAKDLLAEFADPRAVEWMTSSLD
jgi:hypothetical protein